MNNNIYYVYIHRKASDNLPFYVGKGCRKRAWGQNQRTSYWKNIVKKYGLTVQIVKSNLSEQEAFEVEMNLIALYGRFNHPTCPGILCNFSDGGEGPSGVKKSAETRQKLSKALTGRVVNEETRQKLRTVNSGPAHHGFGKPLKEEVKRKLSENLKGKGGPTHYNYGRKQTKECRRKIADSKIGDKNPMFGATADKCPTYKGDIIATNLETGEILRLRGMKGVTSAGFSYTNVLYALKNKNIHQGHSFVREPINGPLPA